MTVSNESPGLSPASSAGELGITELRIQGPCPESVNPNPNLNKIGNFSMDKKLPFFRIISVLSGYPCCSNDAMKTELKETDLYRLFFKEY